MVSDAKKTTIGVIPADWEVRKIKDFCDTTSGGTPSRSRTEYYELGTIPWIKTGELNQKYIIDTEEKITEVALKQSSAKLVPKNTVLMAMYGATIGKTSITKMEAATNQACCAMILKEKLVPEFLYYVLSSNKDKIIALGAGGAQPNISQQIIREIEIPCPSQEEQQKIISILSSIDEAIEKTEAIIEKTEKVKNGLMQQLFTKGIGHTIFKKTEIGEIPENWKVVRLMEVLEIVTRPLSMKDEEEYQLVTVKRRQGGVVPREILKGKEIKVKSQFYIKTGDFLISKRQIVHGACEVVPPTLDNAIVSNEYHTLLPKSNLDMDFFKWYSRTPLMMNYFLLSSVGVHIEKMLFKVEDWFKRQIVLPPLEEQVEIAKTLSSMQKSINMNREYLNKLEYLKKGLMQSLLTGKVRVKVDEAEVTQV